MKKVLIKNIDDKEQWEAFVLSRAESNFLQSYNWGLFQQKLGKKFFSLGIFDEKRTQIGAMMVIKETAKRGSYLTVAGGPLIPSNIAESGLILKEVLAYLKTLAQKEKCRFVRIRPQIRMSDSIQKLVKKAGLKPAPMHLTADLTLELNLDQTEEELLAQMRKNTRYYIRRAQRDGIKTGVVVNPDRIKEFHQHQLYLAKKHSFVPFSYPYLAKQFETFLQDNQVCLINSYTADDKLLASAFIIFYNQQAVYHYGISTPDNDKLPGSYATQWAAIQEAKKRGCKVYNFWGISSENEPKHRFAGVSLFKRGFGGKEIQYLPAHDLPIHPLYSVTRCFELIRKKIRGL
ncbi:MAG: peptidoglycan bridge formation glycyltransferase FemA/FemB family protein [Patescibacteria group bacterium]|nr:peptidoglycan bridge formation glycyltransferase FemA/FemB family protein [Patescibacteria group bacterium]